MSNLRRKNKTSTDYLLQNLAQIATMSQHITPPISPAKLEESMDKTINNRTRKTRVAVLFGGRSSEHEVSVRSATNVIQNLDRERFDVVPIGIDKQGSWYLSDDIQGKLNAPPPVLALKQDEKNMLFNPSLIAKPTDLMPRGNNSERIFDVVFPVIHGTLCEDGTVQGLLELAEIPYVGCGVLASAVGFDKDFSKRLVRDAGLNVPDFLVVGRGEWHRSSEEFCARVTKELTWPVFVKPSNTGSSVGVQKIKKAEDLAPAIETAFLYDTKVIVEQGINAMEIEIAVLEALELGAEAIVSMPGEIRPQNGHEFYSYESKYLDADGAAIIIPADVSSELQAELTNVARKIFNVLDCQGMARVDLFVEKGTDKIYFNEVNTLPGFTGISMYPKLLLASGISYTNLLSHLIDLAINSHASKQNLIREYVPEA
jgi:D-alanine-D-alanine ligase